MKRFKLIKSLALVLLITVGMSSCEDFLNRPTIDNYTLDGFYQTDGSV